MFIYSYIFLVLFSKMNESIFKIKIYALIIKIILLFRIHII